ncbi:MAG: tetratricopeptide repeat protein [Bacteroidales bacterium]|nr:tetratricopeptide repeat protein [Bacteroidales bacterium]
MYRLVVLYIAVACGFVLYGQDDAVRAQLAQADRFTSESNYSEALKHIEAALEINSLSLEALEKKVNVMLLSERVKDISDEIEQLIKVNVQQPEYYYLRALIHINRQKPQKAIDDLNNAVYYQMPEKYLDKVYLNRGMALYLKGDFIKAENDFQAALEINPRNSTVYHSWGMLKYEERNYDDALKYFLKAIQYDDNNPITFYNLAMSYLRIDDMANACYYFNKSCSLGNRNACKVYYLQCTQ